MSRRIQPPVFRRSGNLSTNKFPVRFGRLIVAVQQTPAPVAPTRSHYASKEKLQRELHGSRIGLDICDPSELTAVLVHLIRGAVGVRRQAIIAVRESEVLMVEGVEQLPAELEIPPLGKMKLFGQSCVDVPEARRAQP